MALKTDPERLRLRDALADAVEWTPGVERVPTEPGRDLPGTVRPAGQAHRPLPPDSDHIAAFARLYDIDRPTLKATVAGLVRDLRRQVAARGLEAADFSPLPGPPGCFPVDYVAAEVDGIPVRFLASYSLEHQAMLLSIDCYVTRKPPPAKPAPDYQADMLLRVNREILDSFGAALKAAS